MLYRGEGCWSKSLSERALLVGVGWRMSMLKGMVTTSLQFVISKPKPYWNKSHASAFCCGAPGSPGHVQVVVWWADCSAQVFLLLALKEGGGSDD